MSGAQGEREKQEGQIDDGWMDKDTYTCMHAFIHMDVYTQVLQTREVMYIISLMRYPVMIILGRAPAVQGESGYWNEAKEVWT